MASPPVTEAAGYPVRHGQPETDQLIAHRVPLGPFLQFHQPEEQSAGFSGVVTALVCGNSKGASRLGLPSQVRPESEVLGIHAESVLNSASGQSAMAASEPERGWGDMPHKEELRQPQRRCGRADQLRLARASGPKHIARLPPVRPRKRSPAHRPSLGREVTGGGGRGGAVNG